jgi:hypothetical protein
LVKVRAWADAEAALPGIMACVGDIGSRRIATRLIAVIRTIQTGEATSNLQDGAQYLREILEGAGYYRQV